MLFLFIHEDGGLTLWFHEQSRHYVNVQQLPRHKVSFAALFPVTAKPLAAVHPFNEECVPFRCLDQASTRLVCVLCCLLPASLRLVLVYNPPPLFLLLDVLIGSCGMYPVQYQLPTVVLVCNFGLPEPPDGGTANQSEERSWKARIKNQERS